MLICSKQILNNNKLTCCPPQPTAWPAKTSLVSSCHCQVSVTGRVLQWNVEVTTFDHNHDKIMSTCVVIVAPLLHRLVHGSLGDGGVDNGVVFRLVLHNTCTQNIWLPFLVTISSLQMNIIIKNSKIGT